MRARQRGTGTGSLSDYYYYYDSKKEDDRMMLM